jgi:hypothetical protein
MGEINQERVDNVVLDLALELDEPAAELLAYRSMLVAVNSILHGPAQPQAVAPLRVVRACALRSAIGLVVAILIPPSRPLKKAHNRKRKPERNLMQIFVLPEKYPAVADRLTALNRKRGKLPDPHKLAEARSRHTEPVSSRSGMRDPISRRKMLELAASYDARAELETPRTLARPVAPCLT